MPAALEFAVLGPLEVRRDGRLLPLAGPQQRAVLAVLLAARGQHVPVDRLLEEAWDEPPDTGRRTVAAHVSRLRTLLALPEDVLRFEADGYVLRARPDAVDAERFRLLVQRAAVHQQPDRLGLLDEALGLWRGTPYAGSTAASAQAARRQLEELRLAALVDRARGRLLTGQAVAAVTDLERVVAADPLREEPTRLLATALQRSGRVDQARALVSGLRTRLLEEFGLDPGSALTALEDALVTPDGPLAVPEQPRTAARSPLPPLPLASLVGRDALLSDLPSATLLTLVGAAGAGKSRMALELAHRDGAAVRAWVPVDELDDAALLDQAVAHALGVAFHPGRAPLVGAASAIGDGEALLVLDNVDALRAATGAVVAALLGACPRLRVVVTAREPLGLPGEQLVEVAPLALDDAIVLFLDRAVSGQPAWQPGVEELVVVRRLCAQLDGLPLALELAAARTRSLDVVEIADGLASQPQLLASPGAGLASHHASLDAAVQWTYAVLTPLEQQQLRALAVFEGGFDLVAARAVLDTAAPVAVGGLVRRSFLTVDRTTAGWRYGMLTTVRAFAAARADRAERARCEQLHRRWVGALAAEAAGELRGPSARLWLSRLDHERGNVRAAARTALAAGDPGAALALGADLAWYWYRRGLTTEGATLLDAALTASRPDQPERGRAMLGLSLLQYLAGDGGAGARTVSEAVSLLRGRDDRAALATAECTAAWLTALLGDLAGARDHAERGRALAPSPAAEAEALMVLGQLARFDRGAQEAEELLTTSVRLASAAGDDWVAASSGWVAAKVALAQGRPVDALTYARPAVERLIRDDDVPALLALGLVVAAALAGTGRIGESARVAAVVASRARRAAYDVARMDPLDSPWLLAALPPHAPGSPDDLSAVLQEVLGPTAGSDPARTASPGAGSP